MKKIMLALSLFALSACSSAPKNDASLESSPLAAVVPAPVPAVMSGRVFIDSTAHSDSLPTWATGKLAWEGDGKVFIHANHTVMGSQSVDACYDLTKLDSTERLLSEISDDVKGRIDNASDSLNEDAETVLAKSRTSGYAGLVIGLRITEQYFERYTLGATERITCHSLAEIKQRDYDRVKRSVVDKIIAADPSIKNAVRQKQIDFFSAPKPEAQDRSPASVGSTAPVKKSATVNNSEE